MHKPFHECLNMAQTGLGCGTSVGILVNVDRTYATPAEDEAKSGALLVEGNCPGILLPKYQRKVLDATKGPGSMPRKLMYSACDVTFGCKI